MSTPEPMTAKRLAEICNRPLDEVTPGPWLVSEDQDGSALVYVERQSTEGQTYASVLMVADWATEADVQFVASARRSVPDLIAEITRLRSEAAASRAAVLDEAAGVVKRMAADTEREASGFAFNDSRLDRATARYAALTAAHNEITAMAAAARDAQTGGESSE